MYLNQKKMKTSAVIGKIQLIVGSVFTAFFGIGIIGAFVGENPELMDGLWMSVFLAAPFAWMIFSSWQKARLRRMARRLNLDFRMDADGQIPVRYLLKDTGSKTEAQAAQRLEKLLRKGYLCNCTVEYGPVTRMILNGGADGNGPATVSVTCPHCGATVEKRTGFAGECPYCNSKL